MFISNKKVSDFITEVKAQKPSGESYDNAVYVNWINEVEQPIYSKILEEYVKDTVTYTGQTTVDFPLDINGDLGIRFEDIRRVYVDNVEYSKMSLSYFPEGSYAKNDEKLDISPKPSTSADIVLVYKERPEIKTVGDIATQYINLPDEFIKIPMYYCFKQIHLLKKEYGEAQNWSALYDNAVADFIVWYNENKANYGN